MIKRIFDVFVSLCLLLVLLPLLLAVAVLVAVSMGFPVFFRQERPGLHGRTFRMYKFRTMRNASDKAGNLLPDAERLTRIGSLLRKTSIDELPELFNVLKGDMSLVGPRPLLVQYIPYYTEVERRRHNMRPGITGLAQVSGRNLLPWEERLAIDVEYVDNWSFTRDVRILWITLVKVLKRSDVVDVPGTKQPPLHIYRKRIDVKEP